MPEASQSKIDLICLGELIVDLLPVDDSHKGRKLPDFRPMPGGAPGNVAVGVAKLGFLSMFVGQVGKDFWGEFLAQSLQDYKVDISALHHSPNHPTPLAFVHLSENGERSFSFQRYNSADLMYSPEMLPEALQRCRIFHFGSLTLTQEPVRSSTLRAAQSAKQNGALISFDPNDRPVLWKLAGHSRKQVRFEILEAMRLADVVKVSEEELLFLNAENDSCKPMDLAAQELLKLGPQLICVTRGKKGVLAVSQNKHWEVSSPVVQVIDTTGAGDGFVAGFLAALLKHFKNTADLRSQFLNQLQTYSETQVTEADWLQLCLQQACAVGALATTKKGAMSALPKHSEIKAFQENPQP